jgi:hypothetical protein
VLQPELVGKELEVVFAARVREFEEESQSQRENLMENQASCSRRACPDLGPQDPSLPPSLPALVPLFPVQRCSNTPFILLEVAPLSHQVENREFQLDILVLSSCSWSER